MPVPLPDGREGPGRPIGVTAALVAFELRRRVRGSRFALAVAIVGAAAAGLGVSLARDLLVEQDALSLYRYAYLVGLVLVYRFDIEHDLSSGFADFVAPNFVSRGRFVVARLVGGLLALALFAVVAALVTLAMPGLDTEFALWAGGFWLLLAVMFAPAVALAESLLHTRLPVLAVALAVVIGVLVLAGSGRPELVTTLFGTRTVVYGSFGSFQPLALRALVFGLGGLALLHPLFLRRWGRS